MYANFIAYKLTAVGWKNKICKSFHIHYCDDDMLDNYMAVWSFKNNVCFCLLKTTVSAGLAGLHILLYNEWIDCAA